MKNLLLILALAVSSLVSAQKVSFTIVNDVYTDMAFFDILTIDMNTGKAKQISKHTQAFNGVRSANLELKENQLLVIQKRTHPERELIDEFSAIVRHNNDKKLLVVEESTLFKVNEGMGFVEAVTASSNLPNR